MVTAWEAAAATPDPELQAVTVGELGMIRSVEESAAGVTVTLTPTYAGCPALPEIAADVRRRLAAAGIAPPSPARLGPPGSSSGGPVRLTLSPRPPAVACPRCGSARTRQTAGFGPTPCTALHVCEACGEPFEHVKEI